MNDYKGKKTDLLHAIKGFYAFTKDIELADFLGITPAVLHNWYKRDTLDYDIIISKCHNLDLNKLLKEYIAEKNGNKITEEPDHNYVITYMEKLIEKQDQIIVELSEKVGQLKQELKDLRKK